MTKKELFEKFGIGYDPFTKKYYIAPDGEKAHDGDKVLVKFPEGNFVGTVKKIKTRTLGKILVSFTGRNKSKEILPEQVLKKY